MFQEFISEKNHVLQSDKDVSNHDQIEDLDSNKTTLDKEANNGEPVVVFDSNETPFVEEVSNDASIEDFNPNDTPLNNQSSETPLNVDLSNNASIGDCIVIPDDTPFGKGDAPIENFVLNGKQNQLL